MFRSLFGSIQEVEDYPSTGVILQQSVTVLFVRWKDVEGGEGGAHQCGEAILQINMNIAGGQRDKR